MCACALLNCLKSPLPLHCLGRASQVSEYFIVFTNFDFSLPNYFWGTKLFSWAELMSKCCYTLIPRQISRNTIQVIVSSSQSSWCWRAVKAHAFAMFFWCGITGGMQHFGMCGMVPFGQLLQCDRVRIQRCAIATTVSEFTILPFPPFWRYVRWPIHFVILWLHRVVRCVVTLLSRIRVPGKGASAVTRGRMSKLTRRPTHAWDMGHWQAP